MEKRIGAILIIVENKEHIPELNNILNKHNNIIIGRQGIPLKDKGICIISVVFEANINEANSLTGQIGRLKGILVKSLLTKIKNYVC
ncbi:MAG: CopG family transcriptional regulator [Bacteroidetes bacterium]|nr:CopG family transcriptional regulator [Bacteroidota bacterium]